MKDIFFLFILIQHNHSLVEVEVTQWQRHLWTMFSYIFSPPLFLYSLFGKIETFLLSVTKKNYVTKFYTHIFLWKRTFERMEIFSSFFPSFPSWTIFVCLSMKRRERTIKFFHFHLTNLSVIIQLKMNKNFPQRLLICSSYFCDTFWKHNQDFFLSTEVDQPT